MCTYVLQAQARWHGKLFFSVVMPGTTLVKSIFGGHGAKHCSGIVLRCALQVAFAFAGLGLRQTQLHARSHGLQHSRLLAWPCGCTAWAKCKIWNAARLRGAERCQHHKHNWNRAGIFSSTQIVRFGCSTVQSCPRPRWQQLKLKVHLVPMLACSALWA